MFGLPKLLEKSPRAIGLTLLGNLLNRVMDYLNPQPPNWGVFIAGTTEPAFAFSSVSELSIGGDANISDYPIENGTFTTYNKVLMPNTYPIRLCRDGSEAQRGAFLAWLQASLTSLELFDVLCPENSYSSVTLKSYRLTRSSTNGAAMIVAECIFQEVRQIPAAYGATRITDPANRPPTPAARVNPVAAPAITNFPP